LRRAVASWSVGHVPAVSLRIMISVLAGIAMAVLVDVVIVFVHRRVCT
jgi:hypothetical protein